MKHQVTTEEIISFLNQKKEYYEKILRLTEAQKEVIKSNNVKGLNSIINEKESLIENIRRLDRLNERILKEIFPERNNRDIRINTLLRQLQSIITNVIGYNQEGINRLYLLINSVKAKFDNLNKMQRSQISMRTQGIHTHSYIDILQ